nr:hypothetical protein [Tanacetum cinerariifolium]
AIEKVRLAEDGWNSRDPEKVSLAYTLDTKWRNRAEFATNREEAKDFLTRKWKKELDYRLIKELWAFTDNRIAVRYAYEWHDDSGNWYRSYGNENWEFNEDGLMANRFACINDMPIKESERKFHWPLGRRPDDHPGLSDLGLGYRRRSCRNQVLAVAPVAELDGIHAEAEEQPADAIVAADAGRSSDNRHRLGPVERLRLADGHPTAAWSPACRR